MMIEKKKLFEQLNVKEKFFVKSTKLTMIYRALLHLNLPAHFAIRSSVRFKKLIKKIIVNYKIEAIHAEYTALGQFVSIKQLYPKLVFNLVEHDVTYQSYQRTLESKQQGLSKYLFKIQLNKIRKYEKIWCESADNVFTFSSKDKDLLKKLYNLDNVYQLNPFYGAISKMINKNDTNMKIPNSICFVGQMGREENHEAAMKLIDIVKKINDFKLEVFIIGANPSDELLAMNSKNVHITGFVEDIENEISKCQIAVFPLEHGAGIKLKVLLAFGLGLPVITTAIGAEGIDEQGEVLILVDDEKDYEKEMRRLISNGEYLYNKSIESMNYVNKHFDWKKTEKIFENIYK